MALMLPANHHATFAGWTAGRATRKEDSWSGRRRAVFFLVSALGSWVLVLSPFLLLD